MIITKSWEGPTYPHEYENKENIKLTVFDIISNQGFDSILDTKKLIEVKKFDAYLFMVARNHIYNELRKKTADETFTDYLEQYFLETSALPEQQMMLKETKQQIDKAVQQLSTQQRARFPPAITPHGFKFIKFRQETHDAPLAYNYSKLYQLYQVRLTAG